VSYKTYVRVEAVKKAVLDRHLDLIVGQTERYSKMLAANLAAGLAEEGVRFGGVRFCSSERGRRPPPPPPLFGLGSLPRGRPPPPPACDEQADGGGGAAAQRLQLEEEEGGPPLTPPPRSLPPFSQRAQHRWRCRCR